MVVGTAVYIYGLECKDGPPRCSDIAPQGVRDAGLVFMGAGLPTLPALAGDSKSYAERLFSFPVIGPLNEEEAAQALQDPVSEQGASFNKNALAEIFRLTQGYPYFLQEWGYSAWNHSATSTISMKVIEEASPKVMKRLDENFFRVRYDRLTNGEKDYLRAMAELGPGPQRSSDTAGLLGMKVTAAGPVRDKLLKKGMVYSPVHGYTAFTVPLFDAFMKRTIPGFKAKKIMGKKPVRKQ